MANHTFKNRLAAIQGESGERNWVELLPKLALLINTTRPSVLPAHVTPFEVWFRRPPIWLRPTPSSSSSRSGSTSPGDDDEVSDSETVSEDEEYLLSELTRRITGQNAVNATKMVAKGGANKTYSIGQIVSLAILPKNRLLAKATRLPYRVLKITKGAYTLLSLYGQLKGLH